jgi:hypothetical protein
MNCNYLQRACPFCLSTDGPLEIKSSRRAEDLDFNELRPYWDGFFKDKIFFSYKRCAGCRLLYCPVFFTEEQLASLYASMVPNMNIVPSDALSRTQAGYYRQLEKYGTTAGQYIEIGPDVGLFTKHAVESRLFERFWLFEPNLAVIPHLEALVGPYEHRIVHGMLDFEEVPSHRAGVVAMIHVLDHLLDPLATLKEIKAKMVNGGRIAIVTHNEQSALGRLLGARWPAYCLQHPQIYSPKSMSKLLTAAGFERLRIEKTTNFFPLHFLLKHLLWALKLELEFVPHWGGAVIGLKLGNTIALASA